MEMHSFAKSTIKRGNNDPPTRAAALAAALPITAEDPFGTSSPSTIRKTVKFAELPSTGRTPPPSSLEQDLSYLPDEPERKRRKKMTEPRARAARHKGQLNFQPEITSLLYAFGDDPSPLPETIRVLDEIVTDFIIETCHTAAKSAAVSRRQKIKVEDFKWAVRGDEGMVGRVRELLGLDRELREARKQFDTGEGKVGLERGGRKKKGEDADVA